MADQLHWWVVLVERPSTFPGAVAGQAWVLVCASSPERAIELGGPRVAHLCRGDDARLRVTAAQLLYDPAPQQRRERVMAELPRSTSAWFAARPHLYPWQQLDAAGQAFDYDDD
jgi:hypothetical protein